MFYHDKDLVHSRMKEFEKDAKKHKYAKQFKKVLEKKRFK